VEVILAGVSEGAGTAPRARRGKDTLALGGALLVGATDAPASGETRAIYADFGILAAIEAPLRVVRWIQVAGSGLVVRAEVLDPVDVQRVHGRGSVFFSASRLTGELTRMKNAEDVACLVEDGRSDGASAGRSVLVGFGRPGMVPGVQPHVGLDDRPLAVGCLSIDDVGRSHRVWR
jgi:hypothetical protein